MEVCGDILESLSRDIHTKFNIARTEPTDFTTGQNFANWIFLQVEDGIGLWIDEAYF